MRHALSLHPDFGCEAVSAIEVEVARRGQTLSLRYIVSGRVSSVALPSPAAPVRADGLWQHTCLEAFIRDASEDGYQELNFSPSGAWAAYSFTGYRSGMASPAQEPPQVEFVSRDGELELRASIVVDRLPLHAPWRLGICTVIEETNGRKSYWALAHPPGKADFHHPDGFVLDLPPSA